MNKRILKRYCIVILLICIFTYSIPSVFAQSTANLDKANTISNAYDSIININKQLSVLLKDYFINLVNKTNAQPSTSSLKVYANQLNDIRTNLNTVINSELTLTERSNIEILINSSNSLSNIIDRITSLFKSTDANEQYVLFRSAVYLDTLLNQTLSYFE